MLQVTVGRKVLQDVIRIVLNAFCYNALVQSFSLQFQSPIHMKMLELIYLKQLKVFQLQYINGIERID